MKLNIILLLVCMSFSGRCVYASDDIETVLVELKAKMSKIDTIQTEFIQEKELSIFNEKVVLEGMLFIQKPSRLAWHVYRPIRYSTIIDEDTIRQWDEETASIKKITMKNNPMFGAALEQMRVWVLGNYLGLLDDYKIEVSAREPLVLEFIPLETTPARKVIKKIVINFMEDQSYIHQIYIEEKNGDNTRFTFNNTKLNYRILPKAWAVKQHER